MFSVAAKLWWILHSWLIEDPLWDDPRGLHNRVSERSWILLSDMNGHISSTTLYSNWSPSDEIINLNWSPRLSNTIGLLLTHLGRVTHICVSKLTIIGSDNGLSPRRRQAIIWSNAGILLIRTLGTNFSEILSEIHSFSFKKIPLKMSSGKWHPFCLGLNVLKSMGMLWENPTCEGRLICPEGRVSALNKCNPIQCVKTLDPYNQCILWKRNRTG